MRHSRQGAAARCAPSTSCGHSLWAMWQVGEGGCLEMCGFRMTLAKSAKQALIFFSFSGRWVGQADAHPHCPTPLTFPRASGMAAARRHFLRPWHPSPFHMASLRTCAYCTCSRCEGSRRALKLGCAACARCQDHCMCDDACPGPYSPGQCARGRAISAADST